VIAEVNQGGDLVKINIENSDPKTKVMVKTVRATKGKILRAEPIVTLYENNNVAHGDNLKDLELELVTYTGKKNEESPGRLDALVWGLTFLAVKQKTAWIRCIK
jgi:phage terminase large subunit-like protein